MEPQYEARWAVLRDRKRDIEDIRFAQGGLAILDVLFNMEKELKTGLESWRETDRLEET